MTIEQEINNTPPRARRELRDMYRRATTSGLVTAEEVAEIISMAARVARGEMRMREFAVWGYIEYGPSRWPQIITTDISTHDASVSVEAFALDSFNPREQG